MEKSKESLFYHDYKTLVMELFTGRMVKVAFYFPETKKYGIGGLYYNIKELRLEINHLPRRGYNVTPIEEKDFLKTVCIFLGIPLSYEDAVFYPKDRPLVLFDIECGTAYNCHIKWNDMSFYSKFTVTFSDGTVKKFASEDYEHKYVFLDFNS